MSKKLNRLAADQFAETYRNIISELIDEGCGLRAIKNCLNENHLKTRFGGHWHKTQVVRLLKRLNLKTRSQAAYANGEYRGNPGAHGVAGTPLGQRPIHPAYQARLDAARREKRRRLKPRN